MQLVQEKAGRNLDLKVWWDGTVNNKETRSIVERLCPVQDEGHDIPAGTSEFEQFQKESPLVKFLVHLLEKNSKTFPNKELKKLTVYHRLSEDIGIKYEIGDKEQSKRKA